MTEDRAHETIDLYTSPGCPDCAALKEWLSKEGHAFVEHDLSAPGAADRAKAQLGVRIAPITVVQGTVMYGPAATQIPRLRRLLGSSEAGP